MNSYFSSVFTVEDHDLDHITDKKLCNILCNITPVHKEGRKNLMENHRPEKSLTCIVCKIAEAVVRTRVVDFWSDLDLFNPDQFAYLRGRSTLAQLLTC